MKTYTINAPDLKYFLTRTTQYALTRDTEYEVQRAFELIKQYIPMFSEKEKQELIEQLQKIIIKHNYFIEKSFQKLQEKHLWSECLVWLKTQINI